jgi:hypothetical protein
MIRSGKPKKKTSTADAAGGKFSNADSVASLLNAISGDKDAMATLSRLLAPKPTVNAAADAQEDDSARSDSDSNTEIDTENINETIKTINDVQSQIAEIDEQLARHKVFFAQLPPALRDTSKSAQSKLLTTRDTLSSMLSMNQDKLDALKTALAATKMPKPKSKKTRGSKQTTHDDG